MRIARPPRLDDPQYKALQASSLRSLSTPEMFDFVRKANAQYYHWDELRRRPLPMGLTPIEAWSAVKWSRMASNLLPLRDETNTPFKYWLPDAAQQTLHQVDRLGGGSMGVDADDPSLFEQLKDRILIDSHMEEAIATSQIEGAVTTRQRAKEMLRSGRKPRDRSEQMIINGYRTVQLLRQHARKPMTVELLHEIQRSMTQATLEDAGQAGRFRSPEDAEVHVVDTRDGDVIFTPPPAKTIERRIGRLIDFANADPASGPFMHPLVRAAVLHFWLAYEHPYVDGNGRTARALFYWYMLKNGYWLFEFLTISRIINASRMQYYRSFLYTETDANDLTYFIVHQLDVTRKALDDLHRRLGEMTRQERRIAALRRVARLNIRQRALLDHALRHPTQVYTFESHRRSHGITYQTARTDLLTLVERGLLEMLPSRKPMQFVPQKELPTKLALDKP